MKKLSAISGRILGLAAFSAFAALSQAQPITVHVNGKEVLFDGAAPHMMDNQVMVPIRTVVEQAGGTVDWDPVGRTVTALVGTNKLEINVPSETAKVNGADAYINGPVHIENGWTMVPARFIADSIGGTVTFDTTTSDLVLLTSGNEPTMYPSTTEITPSPEISTPSPEMPMSIQPAGSVIKATLDDELSSSNSYIGQTFTATIDTNGSDDYFGLPSGTKIRGHVSFVQPMHDGMPGVIGITYDNVILNDGRTIPIEASLINADTDIQTGEDGRWTVTSSGQGYNDLKFVGNNSSSGQLITLATEGNSVSFEEINGAIAEQGEPYDVILTSGTELGLRVDQDLTIPSVP